MKISLLGLFACFFLFACSDDENLTPSYSDEDWYVVENNPNGDELDKLRYEIYSEEGITFFYNDTIGSRNYGESYTYYRIYRIGYAFSGLNTNRYTLSYDRPLLKDFTQAYYDIVYPVLKPSDMNLKGFLVVDTLCTSSDVLLGFYWDAPNRMVVLGLHDANEIPFKDMTQEERSLYMSALLYKQVFQYFDGATGNKIKSLEEFLEFFELTKNSIPEWPVQSSSTATPYPYGKSFRPNNPNVDLLSDGTKLDCTESRKFGILKYTKTAGSGTNQYVYFGSESEDFGAYLTLVHTKTDAEIREEYKDWDVIIQKYEFMLAFLKKHGLDLFLKNDGN